MNMAQSDGGRGCGRGRRPRVQWLGPALLLGSLAFAPLRAADTPPSPVRVEKIEGPAGSVEVMRAGAAVWDPGRDGQSLNAGDRLRTLATGRATLRWSDNSTVRLPPLADFQVEAPQGPKAVGLTLLKGLLYFFHRDGPTEARFHTRTASAAIRGTEFALEFHEPEGRTVVTVLDGEVLLANTAVAAAADRGYIQLESGEQGTVVPGSAPRKTAVLEAINVIQWCLYYPGVLEPDELELSPAEKQALAESLQAYRSGDLTGALAK